MVRTACFAFTEHCTRIILLSCKRECARKDGSNQETLARFPRLFQALNGLVESSFAFAVLETDSATPYYLNLHEREVAHTLILGATGSGNAFLRRHSLKLGSARQMELPLSA